MMLMRRIINALWIIFFCTVVRSIYSGTSKTMRTGKMHSTLASMHERNRAKLFSANCFLMRMIAFLTFTASLAGCTRTVEWDEEVPLNVGETIWVHRGATYTPSSAAGNPLKSSWRITGEYISFVWAGTKYVWKGDADLMLLAIGSSGPVLIADANWMYEWHLRHNYKCVQPFYVEFIPDPTGQVWTWPNSIEPWLYQKKANLMRGRRAPSDMASRYTISDRERADAAILIQSPNAAKIVPTYLPDHCKGKV